MAETHGFSFVVEEELCEGDLVAVTVTTPGGRDVQLYADVELVGRTAILRHLAIYGVNVASRELGWAVLRGMARAAMEVFDVDCIRIEEAWRLSGANPGRSLRPIEFRR